MGPTGKGVYLDLEEGIHGRVWQNEGGYLKRGPQYNEELHGPPVPLAHHTGGKHFTEPSMEELIDGLINGEVPRGTLGDEETENRLIQDRKNQLQQQSLKINQDVAMADKMYRVTDLDKKQNNEAWKQFMKGNPNYFYKPIKGRA